MSDQFQRLSTMGFKKDPWVRFGKTKWFKAEEDDPRLERAFLSLCDSTLGAYKSTLRQLDGWLNGQELTNELLAKYLTFRFSQGVTLGHLNNIISAVRFRAKALDQPIPGGKVVKYTMDALGKRSLGRGRGAPARAGVASDSTRRSGDRFSRPFISRLYLVRGDRAGRREWRPAARIRAAATSSRAVLFLSLDSRCSQRRRS